MKFLIVACLLFTIVTGFGQTPEIQPPYKRFPTPPPIKLLLGDSLTVYTKAQLPEHKPLLFMIFSPECSHCQHETEEMVAHKDELKNVQIVMITFFPLWQMNEFIKNYKLNDLPNVIVGRDVYYTTPSFYNIHNLPFLAMYNANGNLIGVYEGTLPLEKLVKVFETNTPAN
jgi:thioredoxin-related protein